MLTAGKSVLGIVGGGIALGVLLGGFAHPVMKAPVEQWWQLSGRPEFSQTPSYEWVEAGPEDLSVPDGYRPDFDYSEFVSADWSVPQYLSWYRDDDYRAAFDNPVTEQPAPAPADDSAIAAADNAEQAAEDAQAAETLPAAAANDAASPEPQLPGTQLNAIW
jgi:hypothetical protein